MERDARAPVLPALMAGSMLLMVGVASSAVPGAAPVTVLDNLGGASRPTVSRDEQTGVRVDVPSRVGDCELRGFFVKSDEDLSSPTGGRTEAAQELRANRAVLRLRPSEPMTIIAQYVHTVLVDAGSRSEPEGNPDATGSGEAQVGRVLLNGYRFDHYDFASEATSPGGAGARVEQPPRPRGEQTYMRIRWFYDANSRVSFSWKIYATGPCDASP